MKHYTKVTDGKLPKLYSDLIRAELVKLSGKEVCIEIKEHRPVKSKYLPFWMGIIVPRIMQCYAEQGDPHDPDTMSEKLIYAGGLTVEDTRLDGSMFWKAKSRKDIEDHEWKNLIEFTKSQYPEVNFE